MLGMDVQFNIISYAVISTKFEASSNLLESFLPLVEHVLSCVDKDYIEEVNINDVYEEIYGYRIHSAILSQLLGVLQQQGKIVKLKRESIQINKLMLKSYDMKETYDLRLRSLISEVDMFLQRKGYLIEREKISKYIIEFLHKNALDFNEFLNYKSNFEEFEDTDNVFSDLIEFFLEERRNNTKHYEFIQDIYEGIVLSSIIISNEDILSAFNEDFHIENVLLDSNYIFRLLDLQTSLEYQAANETYAALKDTGCNFWVCRETIKQIADVIRSISSNFTETSHRILQLYDESRFTGFASACIRRSLTAAKLENVIDGLEETLKNEYNVNLIDENIFNIDMIDSTNENFRSLQEKKPEASEFGIAHDLLLVRIISEKRSKSVYKPTQAKWWVLTDDNKLTNWSTKNTSTKGVSECITESQLATVMWLCNPKNSSLDGLFNTVIALKSQGLIGNGDYIRISQEIERQKERFSHDEKILKKLPLVFSSRMLRIEEYLIDDENEKNAKFDQLLLEVQKEISDKESLIAEQGRSIELYEEQSGILSKKVEDTQSLLTEQTEKLIATLKRRMDDKETTLDVKKKQLCVLESKQAGRLRKFSLFLRIAIAVVLIFLFVGAIPLIDGLENWYSKHQLRYAIISALFSIIVILLELKLEMFNRAITWLSKKIIALLVRTKILKNYNKQIKILNDEELEILCEMNNIQDEIDRELKK